jgi:hypothetical protein
MHGERTGENHTGEQVVQIMRKKMEGGRKYFTTSEYLTCMHIIAQFSSLTAKKKKQLHLVAAKYEIEDTLGAAEDHNLEEVEVKNIQIFSF